MPVKVAGISDATAIAAGGDHSCALHPTGEVSCWGSNAYGELGNGQSTGDPQDNSADSAVPVKVIGISDATAIVTGGNHTCALLRTGEVSCWGRNTYGELGNGQSTGDPQDNSADSAVPVKVIGISDATAIAEGGFHSCALHRTGEVSCWGGNIYGELGTGKSTGDRQDTSIYSPKPVKVTGLGS